MANSLGTPDFGLAMDYEAEAARIRGELPEQPSVVVIGSSSFWNHDSEEICKHVGLELAGLATVNLITGGVEGVGEAVGRSFDAAAKQQSKSRSVFHVLPVGSDVWDYGATLLVGSNMIERREVLGRLTQTYIAIEGGSGTLYEANVARRNGATILPVARTGGVAASLYESMVTPEVSQSLNWETMADKTVSPQRVAAAVLELVKWAMARGA